MQATKARGANCLIIHQAAYQHEVWTKSKGCQATHGPHRGCWSSKVPVYTIDHKTESTKAAEPC